jgi:hypothetical protein
MHQLGDEARRAHPWKPAQRTVIRVEIRAHTGPDVQVDDGYLIISPAWPELTDPWNKSEARLFE